MDEVINENVIHDHVNLVLRPPSFLLEFILGRQKKCDAPNYRFLFSLALLYDKVMQPF